MSREPEIALAIEMQVTDVTSQQSADVVQLYTERNELLISRTQQPAPVRI